MPYDICENSIFLKQRQKSDLNEQFQELATALNSNYSQNGIDACIYLSGSLARQEASALISSNGQATLYSDIDLVIIPTKSYEDHEIVVNTARWLCDMFPTIKSTAQIIPFNTVTYAESAFARDIALKQDFPLYSTLPPIYLGSKRVNKRDCFEAIIHQISGYILNWERLIRTNNKSDIFRGDLQYHYIKLVLECLRSQFFNDGDFVTGYFDVYHQRYDPRLTSLIKPEEIEQFIKSRELFGYAEAPQLDIIPFIQKSLTRLIGLPVSEFSHIHEIYSAHTKLKEISKDVIHCYPLVMSLVIFGLDKPLKDRLELSNLATNIIEEMDKANIGTTLKEELKELCELFKSNNELIMERIFNCLRSFQKEYLNHLADRNSGVTSQQSYLGLTV
ncbi:hypothetical protein Elgi_52390 [Paenibacillus elgii]|uniref:hypothetical protein n=1 Tax=Paenibacillus elgii TaxID=189691 RepID=UPI002D7C21C1|nr:hypothetical protein Elgi_52390 [Paenibacillus elgii]